MLKSTDNFCRQAVLYFIFIWFSVMVFAPNLLVLLASFLSRDPVWMLRLPLNLQNYRALADADLLSVILKSLNLAFFTTLFCLIVAYPFTYIIARFAKERRGLFLMLIIVPFWTNSLIRNYALISVLSDDGIINGFLMKCGVITSPLKLLHTDLAVFIGMTYTLLPFMILPLYTTLTKLDQSLIEASCDLGAGPVQSFLRVTLPLSTPGIISGVSMVFLPAMTNYVVLDMLYNSTYIMGSLIGSYFSAYDWNNGSMIALVLLAIICIFTFFGNNADEDSQARGGAML